MKKPYIFLLPLFTIFCCLSFSACNDKSDDAAAFQKIESFSDSGEQNPGDESETYGQDVFELMTSEEREESVIKDFRETFPRAKIFDKAEYSLKNENMRVFVFMYDNSSDTKHNSAVNLCFATRLGLAFLSLPGSETEIKYSNEELAIIENNFLGEPGVSVELYSAEKNTYYDYLFTYTVEKKWVDSKEFLSPTVTINAEEKN